MSDVGQLARLLTASQNKTPEFPLLLAQQGLAAAADNVHTIAPGPEYNKWDEALQAHGRIRIPRELDEPQQWLNAPHLQNFLQQYEREDRPDGSVILSRRVPMS